MKSILLVRLSAIGDIVFASSLIAALRRAWPDARIVWLVQSDYRALLDHHPDLDEVLVCPLRHWRTLWKARRFGELRRGIATLRQTLRAHDFDLALDLQGLLKSGMLAWLSSARQRIGLGSREGSQWLMTRTLRRGGDARQIGSEYRYLADTLGLPTETFALAVYAGETASARSEEIVLRRRLTGGYAVFCPFTTRPQKHWIEERWRQLAMRIRDEFGLTPVLLGGPADREAAAQIAASEGEPVDLVGLTSLAEAAALIERAALLIAVDTGLGHMGIALNTPTVLLFGATCPYLETARANARVLYHSLPCSPCRRRPTCGGDFDCMRLIAVEEIVATAHQVLHP